MANQVNESSTAYLTVTFFDKNNIMVAPVSATYKIHDVLSGSQILAATPISPIAEQVEITLTPTDNTMVNAHSSNEKRRVTVEAIYGQDDGVNAAFVYEVKNLVNVG
jgi:hypothetical protein